MTKRQEVPIRVQTRSGKAHRELGEAINRCSATVGSAAQSALQVEEQLDKREADAFLGMGRRQPKAMRSRD
jgi:hypothetical protein